MTIAEDYAIDADDFMRELLLLNGEIQLAIGDAFGSAWAWGMAVAAVSDTLSVTLAKGESWLPIDDGLLTARARVFDQAQLALTKFQSKRMVVGMTPHGGADGLAIPALLFDGTDAYRERIDKGVALAIVDTDFVKAIQVLDVRTAFHGSRVESSSSGGTANTIGFSEQGHWELIDKFQIGVVTQYPGQACWVQIMAAVEDVAKLGWDPPQPQKGRPVEIGLLVDDAYPLDAWGSAQRSVEFPPPSTWIADGDPPTYPITMYDLYAPPGSKVDRVLKVTVAGMDFTESTFGSLGYQRWSYDAKNHRVSIRGAIIMAHSPTRIGAQFPALIEYTLVPTPTIGGQRIPLWHAQYRQLLTANHVLVFPIPGPHIIQLVWRGPGQLGETHITVETAQPTGAAAAQGLPIEGGPTWPIEV